MSQATAHLMAAPSLSTDHATNITRTVHQQTAALRHALDETWKRERKSTERLCMAYASGADSDTLSSLVDDVRQGIEDTDRLRTAVRDAESPRERALDMAQRLAADLREVVDARSCGRVS